MLPEQQTQAPVRLILGVPVLMWPGTVKTVNTVSPGHRSQHSHLGPWGRRRAESNPRLRERTTRRSQPRVYLRCAAGTSDHPSGVATTGPQNFLKCSRSSAPAHPEGCALGVMVLVPSQGCCGRAHGSGQSQAVTDAHSLFIAGKQPKITSRAHVAAAEL